MDVMKHMVNDRHLDPSLYSVSCDDETASFLLYNLSGQIVGYQQYRPESDKSKKKSPKDSRYYTYTCKESTNSNYIGVFGLESLHYRSDVLFLTEGVFDSVRLHNLYLPSIAVLCSNPTRLKNWLFIMGQGRKIISICDNDGKEQFLSMYGCKSYVCPVFKDLGDMEESYLHEFIGKILDENF